MLLHNSLLMSAWARRGVTAWRDAAASAVAAGVAWLLEQLDREPTADEAAYRMLWEAQDFSR